MILGGLMDSPFVRRAALRDLGAIARLQRQLDGALGWLEARVTTAPVSGALSRADLALRCIIRYLAGKQPRRLGDRPAPRGHSAWCETQAAFAAAPCATAKAVAAGWRPEHLEERP